MVNYELWLHPRCTATTLFSVEQQDKTHEGKQHFCNPAFVRIDFLTRCHVQPCQVAGLHRTREP